MTDICLSFNDNVFIRYLSNNPKNTLYMTPEQTKTILYSLIQSLSQVNACHKPGLELPLAYFLVFFVFKDLIVYKLVININKDEILLTGC